MMAVHVTAIRAQGNLTRLHAQARYNAQLRLTLRIISINTHRRTHKALLYNLYRYGTPVRKNHYLTTFPLPTHCSSRGPSACVDVFFRSGVLFKYIVG